MSLVGLAFVENFNQLQLLYCFSESNKILYMYKASSDTLEKIKNSVTILGSRLLQVKRPRLNYSVLVCCKITFL